MIKFLLFSLITITSMLHAMDLSDCKAHDTAVHQAVRAGMPFDGLFALMLENNFERQYKFDQNLVELLAIYKSYNEIINALQNAQYLYDHKNSFEKTSIEHAIFRYLDEALDIITKNMSNPKRREKREIITHEEDLRVTKKPRLMIASCVSCGKDPSVSVTRHFIINGNNMIFCNACGIRYKKNGCCMQCYKVFYLDELAKTISCAAFGCDKKIHQKCLDKKSKIYSCAQCMPR